MTTLQLLVAIIARLKVYLSRLDVRDYPDKPDKFVLTHPKGALLVMYTDSDGDNQSRVRGIEVTVVARSSQNATAYLEAVRIILAGWQAGEGLHKLVAGPDGFDKEQDGEWHYVAKFTLPGPAIICNENDIPTRLAELGL